jgi:hypothetical protein
VKKNTVPAALRPWRRNITLLTFIRINFSLIFAISVIASYWEKNGLSIFDIFLLQAIFSFSVVLFEIRGVAGLLLAAFFLGLCRG